MAELLPLALDLRDRRVVVVGAGTVAARKVQALLEAGAEVTLIAPEATDALVAEADAGRLTWHRRGYQADDLSGAWLVIAATDAPEVNRQVAADAAAQGRWCNVAAPPEAGSCHMMAQVPRGPLTLALHTGGASPYAARQVRRLIEQAVPEALGQLVGLMGELREAVKQCYAEETDRRAAYARMWQSEALALLEQGDEAGARRVLSEVVASGA